LKMQNEVHRVDKAHGWPMAWESGLSGTITALILVFVTFAGLLIVGIPRAMQGNVEGVALLGLSQFLAVALFAAVFGRVAPRRRGRGKVGLVNLRSSGSCTAMLSARSSRALAYAFHASFLGIVISVTVLARVVPMENTWASIRFQSVSQWAPVFAVYSICVMSSRIVRKRHELGLGLTPEGIYHWTWFGCSFFRWEAVLDIRAVSVNAPRIRLIIDGTVVQQADPEESWISRLSWFRRKKNLLDPMFLAVNPATSYEALRFYHQHPELRAELGTEASVERIRADNFAA
jgi:hypothetical protein